MGCTANYLDPPKHRDTSYVVLTTKLGLSQTCRDFHCSKFAREIHVLKLHRAARCLVYEALVIFSGAPHHWEVQFLDLPQETPSGEP